MRSGHVIEGAAPIPYRAFSARIQLDRSAIVRPDAPEWWALGVEPPPLPRFTVPPPSPAPEYLRAMERAQMEQMRRVIGMMPARPPRPWHRRLRDRLSLWHYHLRHAFCCSCGEDY